MKIWDRQSIVVGPHAPEILESGGGGGRAIVLEIPEGESLEDHQVHEHAWVTVISGEVEITTTAGATVSGRTGLMVRFEPGERHAVHARATARLLLLRTPWPGDGQPGTMSLEDKATVRRRAAEYRTG